jgi:hypothetical protein
MTGYRAIASAYAYLQVTTVGNAFWQRLRRLRQTRYLIGAVLVAAYFYFFLVRRLLVAGQQSVGVPADVTTKFAAIAALVLLVVVSWAWIVPSSRAVLLFTEAEVAFLFPAPVTRRMLIQFKLLRSQLRILVSAIFMALVFGRGSAQSGHPLLHAAGWWLLISTVNLHFIGVSFTRERLLSLGINPARRRAIGIAIVGVVVAGCWWWLRGNLPVAKAGDISGSRAVLTYLGSVLGVAPITWLLVPFKMVVAPLFATDVAAFVRAALPALLILIAHYFWVVQSDVSFEEASMDVARRRAEQVSAIRSGSFRFRNTAIKPRPVPFQLAADGSKPAAFLWKGLIGLGPMFRLRTWLSACAILILSALWAVTHPAWEPLLDIMGGIGIGLGGWPFLFGPMFMRRGLSQTLSHMDVLKSYPLRGWQLVLGELLSPITVMTFVQWLFQLMIVLSFGLGIGGRILSDTNIAIAVGAALLTPPLFGVMLCVPFAGMLYFPAWSDAATSQGSNIELMGQRMIFFGAYLMTLVLALVPAALLGAITFVIGQWLFGHLAALALTVVVGASVLGMEFAAAIGWLGERFENFDLSQEMPR